MTTRSINATATVEIVSDRNLALSVSLRNASTDRITFPVLAYCPLFLKLYELDSAGSEPRYDGGDHPCPRSARQIEIEPGGEVNLEETVSLESLQAAGVSPGRYRAAVVVTSSPEHVTVDADVVEIP